MNNIWKKIFESEGYSWERVIEFMEYLAKLNAHPIDGNYLVVIKANECIIQGTNLWKALHPNRDHPHVCYIPSFNGSSTGEAVTFAIERFFGYLEEKKINLNELESSTSS